MSIKYSGHIDVGGGGGGHSKTYLKTVCGYMDFIYMTLNRILWGFDKAVTKRRAP